MTRRKLVEKKIFEKTGFLATLLEQLPGSPSVTAEPDVGQRLSGHPSRTGGANASSSLNPPASKKEEPREALGKQILRYGKSTPFGG